MFRFDPGSIGVSIYFKFRDANTGLAKKGLTASSGGANASYTRSQGSATSIALVALALPTSPWSAGGFIEVNGALAPGLYRFDPPDIVCGAGVPNVYLSMNFTGTIEETTLIRLDKNQSNVGPGSIGWTVNVVNNVAAPIAGARVWVTTDAAGTNTVAGTLTTDTFGNVTFFLAAGTYFAWVADPGYSGTNPTAFTVS